MADVLTIDDLIADKKHSTFFAEVVTGKSGGVASGPDISTSTNQVTGQVQKTLPQVLADLGMVVQTWTATSGGTLTNAAQVFLNDKVGSAGLGNYYAWSGPFPKVVTPGLDPAITAGFIMRSDAGLRKDLLSQAGATLVNTSQGQTLEYVTHTRIRPSANTADAINTAAQLAITNKCALDLTGVSQWNINKRLVLTGVPIVICSFLSPIIADISGTYTNAYAVEIGDPSQTASNGRSSQTVILGGLLVQSSARSSALNGVYIKGSWLNIGHIRAYNFNGCGIYCDSVWDSTISRLSVELCGNTSTYALRLSSNDDTFNTTNVSSIQCEQAYHRAIYINALRCVIQNIHAERTYQLTTNDGTTGNPDGSTWLNSYILLSVSSLNQVQMDSATINPPTGETIVAGQTYRVLLNGDNSTVSSIGVHGALMQVYGAELTINSPACQDMLLSQPSYQTKVTNPSIITFNSNSPCVVDGGSIYNWRVLVNAYDQSFNGVNIDNISVANSILGDIDFNNCEIRAIGDTKQAADSTKGHIEFNNCTIQECVGYWASKAIFHGGYINLANIYSQCAFSFFNVSFVTFAPTGNSAYLTRGCTATTVSAWTYPLNQIYPAGTVTERIGYNSAGKIYQNIDGAINWSKIA